MRRYEYRIVLRDGQFIVGRSLRKVAEKIGCDHSGLRKFLLKKKHKNSYLQSKIESYSIVRLGGREDGK